jgi:hypothetical protein
MHKYFDLESDQPYVLVNDVQRFISLLLAIKQRYSS